MDAGWQWLAHSHPEGPAGAATWGRCVRDPYTPLNGSSEGWNIPSRSSRRGLLGEVPSRDGTVPLLVSAMVIAEMIILSLQS